MQLLGEFGVYHSRTPVRVRHCGQRLLAFLGLSRHPVTRSRIAGTLWPESPTAQASASLRATLTRLPRPGGLSLTTNHDAQLTLSDHVEVDVWVCDEQIRRLRASSVQDAAEPEPDDPVSALLNSDVLPLWEQDWVLVERERHRQARLHALERLSICLRQAGRHEEALDMALTAVAGEPLRESAHRRVIEVHLAEGNQAEALRQYAIYRRVLRDELGLSPSEKIRQLLRSALGRSEQLPST
ncbi:MAG TPA: BTAD domain-containing putative transcriptional regulator [Kineosporiaceae bacterium]|nr:BTAD domain-containing putative transcriptional regulator [Kineosporiaceae bacterium]